VTSVRLKFAILKVLAKWPERHISLDEIRREIATRIVNEGPLEHPSSISRFANSDIFRSGWVSENEHGFQITEAGLSLLQSLENLGKLPSKISFAPASDPCLTGSEERSRMFGTEPGDTQDGRRQCGSIESRPTSIGGPEIITRANPINQVDEMNPPAVELNDDLNQRFPHEDSETGVEQPSTNLIEAPAFLQRSFGSRTNAPHRSSASSDRFAFISQKWRSVLDAWRRHSSQNDSTPRTERPIGLIGGAAFFFLSFVTLVACLFAAIALGQIGLLKSDIAALRRELLPLKADLGRLELAEKVRRDAEQNSVSKNIGSKESGSDEETNNAPARLILSGEEIQLIRDYIKPAPSAGNSGPDISVGDRIGTATIPLPSSLTEKVPRLVGASFTTRNGAIVISIKGSLRADAVLPHN